MNDYNKNKIVSSTNDSSCIVYKQEAHHNVGLGLRAPLNSKVICILGEVGVAFRPPSLPWQPK